MSKEIERKFRVDKLPDDYSKYPCKNIEQGYLTRRGPNSINTIRIRKSNNNYFFTAKRSIDGLSVREEVEFSISKENYMSLWPFTDGARIIKKRYLIPWKKWTIELDIFEGSLTGLILAEIEYSDASELNSEVPEWFGEDLSEDPSYTNFALAERSN